MEIERKIYMSQGKAQLGLTLSALFWGMSGVLTQIALNELSTMTLIFFRFLMSVILAVIILKTYKIDKKYIKHGMVLSCLLMVIYISSNEGLKYTSASNAGFIIGANVILVPMINRFIFKKQIQKKVYLKSLICLLGLGLITLKGANPLNKGDFYCFIDTIAYALYIIYNSRLDHSLNPKKLITIQYAVVTCFSFVFMMTFESIPFDISLAAILAVLILGTLCTFLAFYFQLQSQRYLTAEKSSQLLSLIPIFTVLFDLIFVGVLMSPAAILGALLVISISIELPKRQLIL